VDRGSLFSGFCIAAFPHFFPSNGAFSHSILFFFGPPFLLNHVDDDDPDSYPLHRVMVFLVTILLRDPNMVFF